ncbi:uncharacterized protein MELLADRAFT_124394 [Melampsora larici-populina 98AG31]|uniref:Secreted protein n=1 Tax=Melampsora larici-populina (strain 98AG31 / pathotype 3-4-7) TaxID=747676 RepID=F4RF46_MELLP|nr:uncharacterized protein MELLADRAFT_124394 [Melampsora larici-populina 98AG31]EGG09002.1 secreted protein [Melampsora larici-populina 98AG31]
MRFSQLVIAAVLAVAISATPAQKDLSASDAALQRRSTAGNLFERSRSHNSKCGACDPSECIDNPQCKADGCCRPRSERRATADPIFEKKPSGGDKCATCDSSECKSVSSGCVNLGCCHPRHGVP